VDGLPILRAGSRHPRKILNETLNKTNDDDGEGLAQLANSAFAVRAASFVLWVVVEKLFVEDRRTKRSNSPGRHDKDLILDDRVFPN